MSSLPDRARVVVIGAGIVGSSMVYHLARLGWRDIVLLEKGMLPNPGGSTGHASNFIFLTDHSKEMTAFTLESARQYRELGVYDETGGIEVARTPERMEELKRRIASSHSWGIEGARLLTPAEVKEMVPFIEDSVILGGFYTPGVGIVDSLQAGTLMRQKAQDMGVLIGRRQRRGFRDRRRGRPGPPGQHGPGRHRDRHSSLSPAACGARGSPRWPAPRSR